MRLLKQSTAYDLMVFMTSSTDHITGSTGLTLAITASKAGAAFASISPAVTERGNGFYALALTTTHTNTVGDFALHVTATGADPTDMISQVRANVMGDTLPANTKQVNDSTVAAANMAAAYAAFETGTAQGGGVASITLRAGASANFNYYNEQAIFILSGTGAGQTNRITSYDGSTKVATVATSWAVAPDNTSVYLVLGRVE